jgi:hypothetical protein
MTSSPTGMLSRARQLEAGQPLGIRYIRGDAASTDWWDGVSYDDVLCNMALMDIDDLEGALSTAAAADKTLPGGRLDVPSGLLAQTRRSTATTRPRMLASSPRIGV